MLSFLDKAVQLARGQSYWKVKLSSCREFSELDQKVESSPDPVTGRLVARKRHIEWREDIVASGDNAHIRELHLITPAGDARLMISEPYTGFQLKRGTMLPMLGGIRIMNAQIIGRVDNKATGECTAVIWDVQEQKLYIDHLTNVKNFAAWRPGVIPVGAIQLDAVGVRL